MENRQVPTFDEWVEYCFTRGYREFNRDSSLPESGDADTASRFLCLNPVALGEYLIALFEAPTFIADRYTDDQIGDAVWFLFGIASSYFHTIFSEQTPVTLQVKCMSSVLSMYTGVLDRVCCKRGSDPEGRYTNSLKVDIAVYMVWDMDSIEIPLCHPAGSPHLVSPAFEVLEGILTSCQTSTCLASALHGLGHIRDGHPQRVEHIISRFLAHRRLGRRRIRGWLQTYAELAKHGCVQ